MEKKYYKIPAYSMKCRLYPNKEQKEKIDLAIHGVHVAHNVAMYELLHDFKNTNEKLDKDGETIVHFPDYVSIAKAKYVNEIAEKYPVINNAPKYSIMSTNGMFHKDFKKRIESQTKGSVENGNKKGSRPVERLSAKYYTKSKPRRSYTNQEPLRKFEVINDKVIKIRLAKVGRVKVRGFNNDIRFDASCEMTLRDFIELHPEKQITTTVVKDNCNDYWIVFKFLDVYKPIKEYKNKTEIGVDVGEYDSIITSDGVKYDNPKFRREKEKHIRKLNKKLERRYGYANKSFRADNNKSKKQGNGLLCPSNSYIRTRIKLAKLHRKITWKRNTYQNNITFDVVAKHSFIGVETLSVKDMYKKKDKETNKKRANRNRELADAAMSYLLQMIKYKSEWYGVICQPINRWIPSSKKCHVCGYKNRELNTKIRKWCCPSCKTLHDRDINAAINILYYAKLEYEKQCLALAS